MNWILWAKSGLKYFLIALGGVIIAILTFAITGYAPTNPVEIVLSKYLVIPAIVAIIGLIQNLMKHYGDKK